jgi:hypothetical protein
MATFRGDQGVIKSAVEGSTPAAVGEVLEFSVEESSGLVDTTSKGDSYSTHTAGRKTWSGSASCHSNRYVGGAVTAQSYLTPGASIDVEFYPEDDATTGSIILSGTATVTSRSLDSPGGDDTGKVAFSFTGNGALTETAVS